MIQIIAGEKGKGKTKILLDKVAAEVKETKGNLVYLDKNAKHMYELHNRVRLINVKDYLVENYHEFLGFICGILSQDHDLEKIYLDSFLTIASIKDGELKDILDKLTVISEAFHVDFILSISANQNEIPQDYKKDIIVAL